MKSKEAKHLSIEFINRAYELFSLAEENPNDFPTEVRYLSHGFYLKIQNTSCIFNSFELHLIKKRTYTDEIIYTMKSFYPQMYVDIIDLLNTYMDYIV